MELFALSLLRQRSEITQKQLPENNLLLPENGFVASFEKVSFSSIPFMIHEVLGTACCSHSAETSSADLEQLGT